MLLLYAILAGLIVGRLAGGRVSALADLHVRGAWLAVAGLTGQLLLFSPVLADRVGDVGPLLYVLSSGLVFVVLMTNLTLPGMPVLALGAWLNMVAILANGGQMPSSPDAWLSLQGVAALPTDGFSNSLLIGPGTALGSLGDVFVLPRPIPLANVFSIGDVLVGVGAAWCVARAMLVPTAHEWEAIGRSTVRRATGRHGRGRTSPVHS